MSDAHLSGWQPQPPELPRLDLIAMLWELVSPRERILNCGLYQTDAGVELRIAYPDDDLVRSELVRSLDAGRRRAEMIRSALLGQGFGEKAAQS